MAWVIDLDGVVWLASQPVPGAAGAVAALRARGQRVVFVTNYSAATVTEQVARLAACGITATPDDVITSAHAAASLIDPGQVVMVCGGEGIHEAITARGATSLVPEEADGGVPVDAVVVGIDRRFDFDRLTIAMRAVRSGARLVATNHDPTFPVPEGLLPGAGALAAALACAAGTEPVYAGKPHDAMARLLLSRLAGDDIEMVVGDLPSTDGRLAEKLGAPFGLVLTGVTTADGVDCCRPAPTHVARDLASLVRSLVVK